MISRTHITPIIGTLVSWVGAFTTSDLAHLGAAFSGVCAGIYYAVQAAAFIREKFFRKPAPLTPNANA